MINLNHFLGNFLFSLLKILAVAYVLLCLYLYFFQHHLIYISQNEEFAYTKERGKVFSFDVEGKRINVLTNINVEKSKSLESTPSILNNLSPIDNSLPAIIYFGGNAENVNFSFIHWHKEFPNHAIYMLNYRGFNGSEGTPSEASITKDAEKLWEYVSAHHKQISIVGVSLGSGVATKLSAEKKLHRLILITPFYSLQSIAQIKFRFIPVEYLLYNKYLSNEYAAKITAKTLLLIAGNDELISNKNSEQLFNSFEYGVATLQKLANEDHNSISGNIKFFEIIKDFLK